MTTDMCHCIQKHSIQMETKAKTTIDKVKLCSPSTLKDLKYSNLISGYQVMAVRVTWLEEKNIFLFLLVFGVTQWCHSPSLLSSFLRWGQNLPRYCTTLCATRAAWVGWIGAQFSSLSPWKPESKRHAHPQWLPRFPPVPPAVDCFWPAVCPCLLPVVRY